MLITFSQSVNQFINLVISFRFIEFNFSFLSIRIKIGVILICIFTFQQQRHISDRQVNNRRSKTLRNGKIKDEKWSGVQVMHYFEHFVARNTEIIINNSSFLQRRMKTKKIASTVIITFKSLFKANPTNRRHRIFVHTAYQINDCAVAFFSI